MATKTPTSDLERDLVLFVRDVAEVNPSDVAAINHKLAAKRLMKRLKKHWDNNQHNETCQCERCVFYRNFFL